MDPSNLFLKSQKSTIFVSKSSIVVTNARGRSSQALIISVRTSVNIIYGEWNEIFSLFLINDIRRPSLEEIIGHISPLMFDVIYDKPEGVAREIYHV